MRDHYRSFLLPGPMEHAVGTGTPWCAPRPGDWLSGLVFRVLGLRTSPVVVAKREHGGPGTVARDA